MIQNNQLNKIIGLNLLHIRKSKKIMQDDIGDILGVSKTVISKMETGKQNISAAQLIRLVDYLKCSYEDLLNHNNITFIEQNNKKVEIKNKIKKLAQQLKEL